MPFALITVPKAGAAEAPADKAAAFAELLQTVAGALLAWLSPPPFFAGPLGNQLFGATPAPSPPSGVD